MMAPQYECDEGDVVLDLVTVGHFVIDRIISSKITNPQETLGGPPTFVSLAANKLGAKVGAISKVGKDFHKYIRWLEENRVDMSHVQVVENAFTTKFTLTYKGGKRELRLEHKAPQIVPEDVPSSLFAKVIHVSPVIKEIPMSIIPELKNRATLLSIDPQGFLREIDKKGKVKLKRLEDSGVLKYCDVFKSSVQEIRTIMGHASLETSMKRIREYGVKIILVTLGKKGILAYFDERFYHIPACKPKILKNSTGAGDVLVGAFLAEYIQGKEPLWCCCVGSAAASFIIEVVGSKRFGEKNEVWERATEIYEKGIKPLPKVVQGAFVVGKDQ